MIVYTNNGYINYIKILEKLIMLKNILYKKYFLNQVLQVNV